MAFVTWMFFFDGNDLGTQMRLKNKLVSLNQEKIQLREKIVQSTNALEALREDKEKFAREKYYMKKDGEDVFIIDKK
jgi:cell division protein FtsB